MPGNALQVIQPDVNHRIRTPSLPPTGDRSRQRKKSALKDSGSPHSALATWLASLVTSCEYLHGTDLRTTMTYTDRALRGTVLLAGALVAACSGGSVNGSSAGATAPGLPSGHPVVEAERLNPAPTSDAVATTGVVQETLEGGGYTYVRLDLAGTERWVAGPPAELATGDTVTVPNMTSMGAFTSASLGRTFDDLYFTGGFIQEGELSFEHEARVEQVLTSGSYVYLAVDYEDETMWLAAPATQVTEGDSVGWNGGSLMKDFTSSTLERTFAEILFVEGVAVLH